MKNRFRVFTHVSFVIFAAFVLSAAMCRRGGRGGAAGSVNDAALTPIDWDRVGTGTDIPFDEDGRGGSFELGSPVAHNIAPVYFAFDSYRIAPAEMFKVQMAADHLRSNPRDVVVVEGHTDERGSREYNLALGERRALAVRESLIGLGISPERIQTLSFGQEQPAALGTGEAVWSLNRRAEFRILR